MPDKTGYVALLRNNPSMRRLWMSQLLSQVGDWFNMVALFQVVAALGGSSKAVGLVLVVHSLPVFLLSPIAGYVADRFDRRKILIITDFSRMILVLLYLLAIQSGSLVAIFVLMALQHSVSAFFEPAKQALVPVYAKGGELLAANSLYGATWSLTNALGSMLGGLTVAYFGLEFAFGLDAVTFALSGLLVLGLPRPDPDANRRAPQRKTRLRDAVRQDPRLGVAMSTKTVMAIYAGGYWVLLVLLGQNVFPVGEGGAVSVGLLNGTMAVGALIGATAASKIFARVTKKTGMRFFGLFLMRGLLLLGFAFAPNLLVACIFALLNTSFGACIYVGSNNVMHLLSKEGSRGRLFAYDLGFMTMAYAVSVESTGVLIDDIGLTTTDAAVVLAGVAVVIGVLWIAIGLLWPRWPIVKTEARKIANPLRELGRSKPQ